MPFERPLKSPVDGTPCLSRTADETGKGARPRAVRLGGQGEGVGRMKEEGGRMNKYALGLKCGLRALFVRRGERGQKCVFSRGNSSDSEGHAILLCVRSCA